MGRCFVPLDSPSFTGQQNRQNASVIIDSVRIFFKLTKETNYSKEREKVSWPISCMRYILSCRKCDKKKVRLNPWIWKVKAVCSLLLSMVSLVSVTKRRRSWHREGLSVVVRAIFTSPNPRLSPKSRWYILETVASGRISPLSALITFEHRNKIFLSGSDSKENKMGQNT